MGSENFFDCDSSCLLGSSSRFAYETPSCHRIHLFSETFLARSADLVAHPKYYRWSSYQHRAFVCALDNVMRISGNCDSRRPCHGRCIFY